MNESHDHKVGRDKNNNTVYADAKGHCRTYCGACGIALDVGGGCVRCKTLKSNDGR
jgi:hypothetical protein